MYGKTMTHYCRGPWLVTYMVYRYRLTRSKPYKRSMVPGKDIIRMLLLLLLFSHELMAAMQSVVTGQAPIALVWKITSGGKQIKTKDNTHNNLPGRPGGVAVYLRACYRSIS